MSAPDKLQTRILAILLEETVSVAIFSAITHVAVAVSITFFFWGTASKLYLIALVAAMSFINALAVLFSFRFKITDFTADPRLVGRGHALALALALGVGLTWAMMPYMLFKDASVGQQLIVVATAAGLVSDAFCVGPILAVSTALVVPIVAGSAIALCMLQPPCYGSLTLLLIIYTAFVLASQVRLAASARDRIRDRLLVQEQSQTIALLLNDFEEGSSDWLWETDAQGHLRHAPSRMADALGCDVDAIQGSDFGALLSKHVRLDSDKGATATLIEAMGHRVPLHAITVALKTGAGDRWWTLNGKPSFDERGEFTGYRGVGSDVTVDREAEHRVAYFASHDVLTGLSNRAHFQDAIKLVCRDADRQLVALLLVDLDGFKAVNDRAGHGAGDALLRSVAERLREMTPATDSVCRLGGDEFGILLACRTCQEAEAFADELLGRLREPVRIGPDLVEIGASMGIAFTPGDSVDPDELLARADLALYGAKETGKRCWRRFDLTLDEKLVRRRLLDKEMRLALKDGRLELHYQPQISTADHRIQGFEALLRWHHEGEGWISPNEIIPVAEATGFVVEIGRWALQKACSDALAWQGRRVAVNISSIHFRRPDFVQDVERALRSSGLEPRLLEVEITESILLDEAEAVLGNLGQLRALGVRVALDDFGTGYSSLSYLTRFSFDTIKIDRSFVRDLDEGAESAAVVEAITLLARALSMDVVAEGVETVQQLKLVTMRRCGSVQGFLYGRAVPPSCVELDLGLQAA